MKKTITTITLAAIMAFGATFANAGILVSDSADQACSETQNTNTGIIVFGNAGIIVFGAMQAVDDLSGIPVFGSRVAPPPVPCRNPGENTDTGIIVFGNAGIIVFG